MQARATQSELTIVAAGPVLVRKPMVPASAGDRVAMAAMPGHDCWGSRDACGMGDGPPGDRPSSAGTKRFSPQIPSWLIGTVETAHLHCRAIGSTNKPHALCLFYVAARLPQY